MRSFNIEYYDPEGNQDETQLDISDADFESMFNALIRLFGDFCEDTYCVVVVNKREKTCAAYELPFDMETCGIHFFAFSSADLYFKTKCKEHGVESCEVSKLYRWYQKYD